MKKLLVISLLSLMLLSSCGNHIEKESEVKLLSMTVNETNVKQLKRSNFDYQYVVLDETENEFAVTIKLSNPNDYHILDFNLECDDEDLQVMIGNSYTDLKPLQAINWKGDTNTLYTLNFKSTSSEFLSSLRMTKLLYIERLDSKVSYDADVSTNNEVSIYRIHSVKLDIDKYGNSGLAYEVSTEDTHVENLRINDVESNFNEKYETLENLNIEYDYNLGEITLNETLSFTYKQSDYIYCNAVWNSAEGTYFEIYTDYIAEDTMLSYKLYKNDEIVQEVETTQYKIATTTNDYNKAVVSFNNIELTFII